VIVTIGATNAQAKKKKWWYAYIVKGDGESIKFKSNGKQHPKAKKTTYPWKPKPC
jgi:hypothetical protein